jgi:hypothetical protein
LQPKLLRGAGDIASVLERERRLLTRFRQRSLPFWPQGYPQDEWEHMFAMQHHGVPTRLLDWSENLLVALYFALGTPSHHADHAPTEMDEDGGSADTPGANAGHDDEDSTANTELPDGDSELCVPVVWCLDAVQWNRAVPSLAESGEDIGVLTTADEDLIQGYEPEDAGTRLRNRKTTPVALYGTHNSARIVAQRGTFTLAGGRELKGFEDYAPTSTDCLWKIHMTADRVSLLADLAAIGVTESMIYPDLPGLAREIESTEGWS